MTVYDRIESLRKSKKISQGKLEKELGFSNGSVSKWKTSMPTPERLKKIADYFGVTVDFLMTGKESVEENTKSVTLNIENNAFLIEMVEKAQKLQNEHDKEIILSLLDTMLSNSNK